MHACIYIYMYMCVCVCACVRACVRVCVCDWILENRPNCHTGQIPLYFPSYWQLMATLLHYTYTVPLPGLVDWSAFLE